MSLSQEAERNLFSRLGFSVATEVIPALNSALVGTSPVFSSGTDAAHLGFFGTAAHAQTGAFTQTYATVSHTHANATSAALTDSTGGSASPTLAALTNLDALTDSTGGTPGTTFAAITAPAANATTSLTADMGAVKNALASTAAELALQKAANTVLVNAVASLAAQVNALRVDLLNAKQVLNAAVNDLKLYGLFQ